MIQGVAAIRRAYQDEEIVRLYIEQRFVQPLGALLHRRQVAALRQTIQRLRPRQVLEIAPGPARLTTEVAAALQRPGTLVDTSLRMLEAARARLEAVKATPWRCVAGDAFSLPLGGQFDMVYAFRLIRHFERADRMRLYEQVRRILRPGGVLVFDAVNRAVAGPLRARAGRDEFRHYDAMVDPAELEQELGQAGFELVDLRGVQHHYRLLSWIQVQVAPRSRRLARAALELVDGWLAGGEPLEWVVTCRRA
jgi:SAM-dependent methyltransferase